jgi:hypothetical protein
MRDRPLIQTAIPKRRYQMGEFSASLLGEIDSRDNRSYRYILAFVQLGQTQPVLYVCAEQSPADRAGEGRYQLRMISEGLSAVLDVADRWGDLDAFSDQALKLGSHALGLQREQIVRLM